MRIRVKCAGINFADLMARIGLYPDAPKIPCVVGYEVSGVIDAIGKNVTRLKVGDRVFGMPRFGGYTDTLVINQGQAFAMPDAMTFEEAAALPVVYLTAHHMMLYTGNLRPGSTILLHSAAGGVGVAALQLAKARDCVVYGIASKSKHDFIKEQGCQHPIDTGADYVAEVKRLTNGRGVDLVLDPVGGRSWTEGYELLAPAGRLVAFGMSAVAAGKSRSLVTAVSTFLKVKKWSPMTLMGDNKTVQGVNMGHLFTELEMLSAQFMDLVKMYERGEIKPYVDRTFSFDDAAAAHHYLHDRKAKGKVLLAPNPS